MSKEVLVDIFQGKKPLVKPKKRTKLEKNLLRKRLKKKRTKDCKISETACYVQAKSDREHRSKAKKFINLQEALLEEACKFKSKKVKKGKPAPAHPLSLAD